MKAHPDPKPPARLYHASPWVLKPEALIRPRWSLFALQYKVWITASMRSARATAAMILESVETGLPGYAGTTFGQRDLPGDCHGVWIYRVKPTGPVERGGKGEWTTSFPVRVLEIAGRYGEPERNQLDDPPLRSDDEVGAYADGIPKIEAEVIASIAGAYRDCPDESAFVESIGYRYLTDELATELFKVLQADQRQGIETVIEGWLHRKAEEAALRMQEIRRREHHKRLPDPRYDRAKLKRL